MKDHERAMQAWSALALAATNRQVLTYDILAGLIGVPRQGLSSILDHVARYCEQREFPPLTVIVTKKHVGKPGSGFWAVPPEEVPAALMRVHAFDWLAKGVAPTADGLEGLRP